MYGMIEGFRDFSWILQPAGVYVLLHRGVVVYAGQSLNIAARLATHHNNMRRVRQGKRPYDPRATLVPIFDEVRVKFVDKRWLGREEAALIERYKPRFNSVLKNGRGVPDLDLSREPFFQDLIAGRQEEEIAGFRRRNLNGDQNDQ